MKKLNRNIIRRFTATTTLKQILEANANRKALLILNNGSNIVDFHDGSGREYGKGFPLSPTNALDDDHFNPQGELWVIATTGDTELCVWEILSEEVS